MKTFFAFDVMKVLVALVVNITGCLFANYSIFFVL